MGLHPLHEDGFPVGLRTGELRTLQEVVREVEEHHLLYRECTWMEPHPLAEHLSIAKPELGNR